MTSLFYYNQLKILNQKKGDYGEMIVIDGVVGVGKSTLMEILEKNGYIAFKEPVTKNPILDKFYYDRERYSFPLQIYFLNERFKQIKKASQYPNSVLDRSIYGDVIFAKMLRDNGEMSEVEFQIYLDLFGNMMEHLKAPKLLVYLEISTDEAIKRIKKRGREYEQVVEREYWERLNQNYRDYFEQYSFSPVLKINVDQIDFENNLEDREYVLNLIEKSLHTE